MNDVIYETVVTSVSPQGRTHVAPMGVRYQPDVVVLMPFVPSTTLSNILATRHAVLNIVLDTRVFAGCVTGRKDWSPSRRALISRAMPFGRWVRFCKLCRKTRPDYRGLTNRAERAGPNRVFGR